MKRKSSWLTLLRQIVTNHLLQFLAIDRSDPKKFQVLQLIASLLGWTDEERERAGLARPGASSAIGSLRLPLSPFRRTPSTPSLNTDALLMNEVTPTNESLAELWSNFLEQEANEAGSRRGSTTTPHVGSGSGGGGGGGFPGSTNEASRSDSTSGTGLGIS
jgi:hypothetical protein